MSNLASNQSWWDSNMAKQLFSLFQGQFQNSRPAYNFLLSRMQNGITHPQGYSPAALAAARTGAIDNTSREFSNEQRALNEQEMTHGGADLPSGVNAQVNAGLGAAEAAQKANAENQITMANEDLKNQNYWKSVEGYDTAVNQAYRPYEDLNAAESFTGAVPGAVQAANEANKGGFGAELQGSIAQGLGGLITGQNIAGAAKALGFPG